MKCLPPLAFFAMLVSPAAAPGQMTAIHSVYILPMAGGLDQYLAEWLTRGHVVQVVADPKVADAVLTDRIGEAFEQKLAKIHPRDEDGDDEDTKTPHPGFRSNLNQGTIFLVEAKSRRVLWSDFEKPGRSAAGASRNREAGRIAKKLQEAFGK